MLRAEVEVCLVTMLCCFGSGNLLAVVCHDSFGRVMNPGTHIYYKRTDQKVFYTVL